MNEPNWRRLDELLRDPDVEGKRFISEEEHDAAIAKAATSAPASTQDVHLFEVAIRTLNPSEGPLDPEDLREALLESDEQLDVDHHEVTVRPLERSAVPALGALGRACMVVELQEAEARMKALEAAGSFNDPEDERAERRRQIQGLWNRRNEILEELWPPADPPAESEPGPDLKAEPSEIPW